MVKRNGWGGSKKESVSKTIMRYTKSERAKDG